MGKNFDDWYYEWKRNFDTKEVVDLKKHFSEEEFEMFKKLGIEIKDKIYTEAELEILDQELILYYIDDELEPEVLQTHKSLDGTGVSKEQWQELSNRISEIEQIYHFF